MKQSIINKVSASNFKKHFLQLVDEVTNKKSSFIITKRKIPVARVVPLENKIQSPKSFFGCMRGMATIKEDIVNISFEAEWDINND